MYSNHPKHEQLIANLEKELILPKDGLNPIYTQLEEYAAENNPDTIQQGFLKDLQEPFQTLLSNYLRTITTIAIDFPVFFKSFSSTKKTVMVCAMDSLPPIPTSPFWKDKKVDFKENIGFWAPFSLIENWQNSTGSMKTNLPFFRALLQEYNLYVTDIYKVFFRLETQNGYTTSNALPSYTNLCDADGLNIHGKIVAKEVEIVNPVAIITLGNAARNTLLNLNTIPQYPVGWQDDVQSYLWGESTKIIASPHISGAANGAKSAILKNAMYNKLEGDYQNERLAKICIQKLRSLENT